MSHFSNWIFASCFLGAIGTAVAADLVATGSMGSIRAGYAAALLPDGRVLIASGVPGHPNFVNPTTSSEIYDPATGTFSPTGSMAVGRRNAQTAVLDDGRVLVAGGITTNLSGGLKKTETAEIYDPNTGQFSPTGSMSTPRGASGGTPFSMHKLSDGRVVALSGPFEGGSGTATPNIDIFTPNPGNPSAEGFVKVAELALARSSGPTCLFSNDEVLERGGQFSCCSASASQQRMVTAEMFDPSDNSVRFIPNASAVLPAFRRGNGISLAGDRCFMASLVGDAELYDRSQNQFVTIFTQDELGPVNGNMGLVDLGNDRILTITDRGVKIVDISNLANPSIEIVASEAEKSRNLGLPVRLLNGDVLYAGGFDFSNSPPTVTNEAFLVTGLEPNTPPTITEFLADAEPLQVGTAFTASAQFTDAGLSEPFVATLDWGDGTIVSCQSDQAGNCAWTFADEQGALVSSHSYAASGVYTVELTITDVAGASSAPAQYQFAVAFDPTSGFVTGNGQIDSPAGALAFDPSQTGRAIFGFVSKYQRGQSVPSGNTRFRFQSGGFSFQSTSYDWLVVAGPQAKFKGDGEVNGAGSFKFIVAARDGDILGGNQPDLFRIKVWEPATGDIVYDNERGASEDAEPTTTIVRGQISVQQN